MGKPRIKINVSKEVKRNFRKFCLYFWELQFAPEFTGPNQGATCENCLHFKNGECFDHIPPEMCIQKSAYLEYLAQLNQFGCDQ